MHFAEHTQMNTFAIEIVSAHQFIRSIRVDYERERSNVIGKTDGPRG